MSTTALLGGNIVSPNKPDFGPSNPWLRPCDDPENGGITGNSGKYDKPIIDAREERPKMIDPETGEWVYVDEYIKEEREKEHPVFYLA